MLKGIIFDLDGVIVHTDKYHYTAWKELATRLNLRFDEVMNNKLRGVSRMASLQIILDENGVDYSEDEKLFFTNEKNEIYKKLLSQMTPKDVSEEVLTTIKTLKKGGYLLAIGSSSKNAKYILERVGITNLFDAISDGNNITKSKPDPEVFIKASEFLGLESKYCAIVEDAVAGVQAGKNAGMKTIAIGDAVNSHTADYDIINFGELIKIVDKI